MIWFTSDWHLDHANTMKYCNRPFRDVGEMNRTITNNFFNVVRQGDTLYFLGDLSFGEKPILDFLSGVDTNEIDIHFIKGNHDKDLMRLSRQKEFFEKYFSHITISDILSTDIEGQSVTMMHYPMLTFNKSHFGAWMLYGHHHNGNYHKDIPPEVMGKKMNVGVDVNDFKPVSWTQVKAFMAKQPDNFDLLKIEDRRH